MERLREENEELKRNCCESDAKLNVLRRRIRLSKVRSANYKKAYDNQQNQLNSLLKSLENMSYLQQENTELKAEKEFLIQQLNPNTKGKNLAKKWLKIPLENRVLKIKGRNLFLKIA
ncbi:uncharacterized protein LOC111295207 [Durio zibethinus]|uniref:Uncharacterized protein LOC111295207 n=1 Tax=Durio zibethinus TaxID=66656 RepID=A0A6P5YVS2_DURZI|nr:uncharacterized protein LOC111295207 [Durio zibethinus]